MPVQVVRSLEEEQWQKRRAGVRARPAAATRGFWTWTWESCWSRPRSARWCRLPWSAIPIPRVRRIAENLGRRVLYVGITAVLAVPVWFATRGHFDGSATRRRIPPRWTPSSRRAGNPVRCGRRAGRGGGRGERSGQQAGRHSVRGLAGPGAASALAPAAAANTLDMQFSGDSWVDIGPDGSTVEKALIKSGESAASRRAR